MVRAKLIGFLSPSSETLKSIKGDDPPARYARAIALYRLGHLNEALPMVDRLIAEQRTNPWLHELKGQILFENGRVREALAPYREAVRLAPDQPQIRIGLAHAMVETGDPLLLRPAIQELQPALDREHENTMGWRTLATAWGKLGDIGQANLALAEEALENDKIPLARGLAARAQTQLPPGPARVRAVDISNAVKKENRTGF
jgi:predicted Zn-dependent protease